MDLNRINFAHYIMASAVDGWPVWIPLIVGLAPGLVYWFAITAMKKRR
jgi:hypothetical protein